MNVTISFENETDLLKDLPCEELAMKVAEEVLRQEELDMDVSLSLEITDNEGIHEVNREYRGIDRATDVLSFPALPPEAFTGEVEVDDSAFDMETGNLILGDILISAEKVLSQARDFGHSPTREFCFLVAHSMLHLLGYDHMQPQEERTMREKQEAVLNALGITRG